MRGLKSKNNKASEIFLFGVCFVAVLLAVSCLFYEAFAATLMTVLIGLVLFTRIFFSKFLRPSDMRGITDRKKNGETITRLWEKRKK